MAATASTQQPLWQEPVNSRPVPVLKILNTLTRTKTPFTPMHGNTVKWYNCGPTVYDHAHLGHARNYVSQDVIRRIMTDYFGYDVYFVMNITDIEDKIIQSSRKRFLFNQFRSLNGTLSQPLLSRLKSNWIVFFQKHLAPHLPALEYPSDESAIDQTWLSLQTRFLTDRVFKLACLRQSDKFEMNFNRLRNSYNALEDSKQVLAHASASSESRSSNLIDACYDVLTYTLDDELKHTVDNIQQLSRDHASFWEAEFMKDMEALHVRPPDVLTRVTEYVPEIVAFIENILKRGFAYQRDGNVWFDTDAFDGAPIGGSRTRDGEAKHWYLKLEPWSRGNKERAEEGEGTLINKQFSKRQSSDFALWKASRPGEPSWPSPWGAGRPGWHIECSVMASDVLGETMDIHSGGEDLTFPHHDNEIAQSEAYHDCQQWVNYFIHTGHLHIEGLKMSKSLKNFITIQDILKQYSARQLRLCFLTQLWSSKLDFTESVMNGEVKSIETTLNNFFATAKAVLNQNRGSDETLIQAHYYNQPEKTLQEELLDTQYAMREALSDSFNTPQGVDVLMRLVSKTNVYISSQKADKATVNSHIIKNVSLWVTKMLRVFGLDENPAAHTDIGWGDVDGFKTAGAGRKNETLMPYLHVLSTFRDDVRNLAMNKEMRVQDLLALCDKVRDEDLVPLGVALDDQEDGRALIKLVPAEVLIRSRNEKRAVMALKEEKRAANLAAEREKKRQQMEEGKIAPGEMFKGIETEFGTWDQDGIPLTLKDGGELSKSGAKKVRKLYEQQQKKHAAYLKWIANEI